MDVNFELYKVFYVVANCGSVSKGAEELMISQPAVTQSIKTLEGQLDTTLFVRTKKGVILTEEGRELYYYVKEGMNYFVNGFNKIVSLKQLDCGILKIGASTSITEHYLMPYITKFHELYPNIEIKIVNNLTDTLLKDLRNGNVDIVIGSYSSKENKDLSFFELTDIHDIFISNQRETIDFNNLSKKKVIIQTVPSVTRVNFNSFIKSKGIDFEPYMEVVSHRLVTEFVKSGIGIGVATKEYILKELACGNLYEVKTEFKLPSRKIGYALSKDIVPSYRVKEFVNILKNGVI